MLLTNYLTSILNSKFDSFARCKCVWLIYRSVPTETYIGRFDREKTSYALNLLTDVDWNQKPPWFQSIFLPKQNFDARKAQLTSKSAQELEEIMSFCLEYHAEDEMFWIFDEMIKALPLNPCISTWIDRFPPLVFALLKKYPPEDSNCLAPGITAFSITIVENIIRSANTLGIASLVALEKISSSIADIAMTNYLDLLMLAAHSVRSPNVVQEVLLVLHEARASVIDQSEVLAYVHKHALAITFDRAEEAADECPCDDKGVPRKRSSAIPIIRLLLVAQEQSTVVAHVRIDRANSVRLHSHIRLQAAAEPEKGWIDCPVLDGIVVQASKGELKIKLQYPPPPETEKMQWKIYNAGNVGK